MNLARTFRTVRHLSASQWAYRFICRGMFVAMETFPGAARARFEKAGAALGAFDLASDRLEAAAAHVVQLQRAVHGAFLDGIADGRFTLLNREIDFGGLEQVEWRRELGEKNNRLWRMNLSYMGYLVALVERYGADAVPVIRSLLASMTAQNPWSSKGVFRDVWHPYSVSHRVINLITCLSLLERRGITPDRETLDAIEAEIRLGAAFLLANLERDLQYNHLFKNFVTLAIVKAALAEDRGFARGPLREVHASIRQQFLDDGGHAERCPMYHLLSLVDLRILRDSRALEARSADAVDVAIRKGEQVVNAFIHPDGDVALFNDSWLSEAPAAIEMSGEAVARPEAFLRIEHEDVGYARLAQGGDNVVMDYGDCGPDANPGHAHADFLSLEASVAGLRAIVDPGVPTYSEGEMRNVSRSAASHNGPCLVGAEPIEFWASFRVGRRGYAHRLVLDQDVQPAIAGWHNGYAPQGLSVARAVRLYPGRGLLVVDIWQGAPGLPEQTSFIVPAPWRLEDGALIAEGAPTIRPAVLVGEGRGSAAASYCLRFGLPQAGTRLLFAPIGDAKTRQLVTWFDWSGADTPPHADADALSRALLAAMQGKG